MRKIWFVKKIHWKEERQFKHLNIYQYIFISTLEFIFYESINSKTDSKNLYMNIPEKHAIYTYSNHSSSFKVWTGFLSSIFDTSFESPSTLSVYSDGVLAHYFCLSRWSERDFIQDTTWWIVMVRLLSVRFYLSHSEFLSRAKYSSI